MPLAARYAITGQLAEAGGWSLRRGRRSDDGAAVLLELLDTSREDAPRPEVLRHEQEVTSALRAAPVLRPIELGTHRGRPVLVLQDFDGVALESLLSAPLPPERFLPLAIALASALADLHHEGLVHRELRPGNVLVATGRAEVRLVGLGASGAPARAAPLRAPQALIAAALPYVAPEQTGRMNAAVDGRADLYALGVILYRMLTGRLPFEAQDALAWVHCHVARIPPSPVELVPGLPSLLGDLVTKLLAKMPDDRYQSASGLRHDLERCLTSLQARGAIEPFPLGERDRSERLQLPQRLYGRGDEVLALLRAFHDTAQGGRAGLVLVSGGAGVGKSALALELQKRIAGEPGLFLAAKLDAAERNVPYSTFVRALRDLVLVVASRGPAQVATWRERILEAVGTQGQVLADVLPALETIIGPQPAVPALPPEEARNRFSLLLRRLMRVFAREDHPLAVFLDDLQWADAGTAALLRDLLTDGEPRHLLLVGAYRDGEVTPGHPLLRAVTDVRESGAPVTEIRLGPLAPEELARFVQDALRSDPVEAGALAALVAEKTGGNPFFAIQFLTELHDEHLVAFDAALGRWRWDVDRIRAKGFSGSVVDLLVAKLRRLSPRTVSVLERAASIGATADLGTLAALHERSEEETRADLAEAVQAGLVVPGGDGYRLAHDRVQEAAYSLLPPGSRAAAHLRAGRLLLSYHRGERLSQRIFDVVNQLDRGLELVQEPGERAEILALNLLAARKAKAAGAFESARSYFWHAAALLAEDAWEARPDETLELKLELAECELLGGSFEGAHALLDEVMAHALDRRQRARACGVRMRLFQVAGRWGDAVTVALEALRAFGVTFPEQDDAAAAATRDAIAALPGLLRGRTIAELADAPMASDPDVRATLALLVSLCPASNLARPALLPLVVLTALRLALEHGNTEEACFAYSAWATVLVGLLGDAASAHAYSEMSLRLNARLGDARLRGTLLYLHATFVQFWREPLASVFPVHERALEALLQAGDLVFAGYLQAHWTWLLLESGIALDDLVAASREHVRYARLARSEWMASTIQLMLQVPRSLQGLTRAPGSLDDEAFQVAPFVDACARNGFVTGVAVARVGALTAATLYGRWEEALAAALALEPLRGSISAMCLEYSYRSYAPLAAAVLCARAEGPLRDRAAAVLAGELPHLEGFARQAPSNFGHLLALVRAEIAQAAGRDLDAVRLYEEAAAGARAAGFTHREALANELAASFHRSRGLDRLADLCLREACDAYRRWGAAGKVRQLEAQHPALLAPPAVEARARGEQLDLLSVVKASQSISREMVVDRLVGKLLQVALELGGARRGCLVLARGEDLAVEAEASLETDRVSTLLLASEPIGESLRVPAAAVRRAWVTRAPVLVDDAGAGEPPVVEDPYLARRRVRSLLALPLGQRARIVGVLYLENELVAGAFTRERLTALELLGFQAAISVENARLYEEARHTSAALAAANAQLKAEMLEREQAEAARAAAEIELRQAQKMQSIGLLAGGVAHDFNNLLTPILGNAECIAADLPPQHPDAELVDEIRDAALRARDLTRQLLAVGRRQMLELERVDLAELVRRFERMLRRMIREDIRIDLALPEVGTVRADPGQIGQVLLNLAVNAQDAMPGPGLLTLAARNEVLSADRARSEGLDPGAYVVLAVTDTGSGMDPETRERLFEPFFTTKERGRGTGLGLSTAYGIVRQHGGTVLVRSEPGRGSTFEVYLPQVEHGLAGRHAEPAPAARPARGTGETILVVEDDAAVRSTACELLRRLGYRVLAAEDLQAGEREARAQAGRIDLLLSDIIMPSGNGKEVFERLRETCPGLRVLYMSGYTSDVIVHRGVLDEGVHFIQKPLTMERLADKLRAILHP